MCIQTQLLIRTALVSLRILFYLFNMKVFVSLFCVAFVCISRSSCNCPDGWTRHGSTCYHFSHDTESMPVAAIVCQQLGGSLAEIETEEEGIFLSAQVQRLDQHFWIGLSDIQEEGTWLWYRSKTPLRTTGYTNWAPSQPDNYKADENCVLLWKGKGQWGDNPCHNFWRYICEKADQSAELIG